jgi:dTDP-4-dehydrorhamnose reductase
MRVAVTGAQGRLGRALISALGDAPFTGPAGPIAWTRRDFDLDAPESIGDLLDRDRPEVVVHTAAWTDVDGCARDPELAMRRNGIATGVLAQAAAERGTDLVAISTNEVFDGRPPGNSPGLGYRPSDAPDPINPYGRSKLAGERYAEAAYDRSGVALGLVRTAWLFGPPGGDYPAKILAAAERAMASGEPLRLVADEAGSPTYTHDLAEGIVELLAENAVTGVHHIVNTGVASRKDMAEEVFRQAGISVPTVMIMAADWSRLSTPPIWGVLEPTPLPSGELLRTWQGALADYMPALLRQREVSAT